ncbi:hypothetical protein [Salinibacillus xinjiangensis]|uniref:Lipoprotein n=1 Tax=Salinibacillus xinjiangensis TaxID=1229268 RepID=A0A6G1X4V5_9BACI|nr:hypothetical protein [Salinibacillus xinjiangensis]MRG85910.1 hypothetical protein [Salinibacillus xinjiangensis]
MRIQYVLLVIFLTFLVGCESQDYNAEQDVFQTKEAAIKHFLDEFPRSDIEHVKTTDDDELFIVRSGNHQYDVYGMENEHNRYSIVKLTATLSLHNTIAGSAEFHTPMGNDYTYLVVKQNNHDKLPHDTRTKFEMSPILSGDAELSLNQGHIGVKSQSIMPTNVIKSTETIVSQGI